MLIDVSYFTSGPRHILNATTNMTPQQNSVGVNRTIMGYVKHYQMAFLCEMLGDALALQVNLYMEAKDAAADTGTQFEPDEGLEQLMAKLRESFADYVFFYILRDASSQATDRGLVVWKNENEVVSPISRQVSVWNEMVNRNIRFKAWAGAQSSTPYSVAVVSDNMVTRINTFNL